MAFSKALFASMFFCLPILHLVNAVEPNNHLVTNLAAYNFTGNLDCGGACEARCIVSSRPRLCKRARGTCCYRCDCVPPGTSGNHHLCPCYATMTTRDTKPKCP